MKAEPFLSALRASALLALLGGCGKTPPPSIPAPWAATVTTPVAAATTQPETAPAPRSLAVAAPELGQVLFVSTVPLPTGNAARLPLMPTVYSFGQTLYARIRLPLTADQYQARYGLDHLTVHVQARNQESDELIICSNRLSAHHESAVDVAILADARVPAELDCTASLVKSLARVTGEISRLSVEVEGSSNTPGIRDRLLVHDEIDLGVSSLPSQLEKFALDDRHLREELVHEGVSEVVSRMPDLDGRALVALESALGTESPGLLVRAVISSTDWHYARDVRTGRAVDRFVVGVATMRGLGACELRDVLFAEPLDAHGSPQGLRADLLPASDRVAQRVVRCAAVAGVIQRLRATR